jgi:hypothetical protein
MAPFNMSKLMDKQTQIVLFSSTAIALYGYDQGHSVMPCSQAVGLTYTRNDVINQYKL